MPQSTLFIPDISGFTKFIHNTEIEHSQHIIEELLTLIIDAGKGKLDIAEIEGDAVFFFKENVKYSKDEITEIARDIFQAFQTHLLNYENRRICSCGACSSAADLTLKFVVHSGDISITKIGKDVPKPFGESVITVHRLLKPKIAFNEYILFSKAFLENETDIPEETGLLPDADLGDLSFNIENITNWKMELPEEDLTHSVEPHLAVTITDTIKLDTKSLHQIIIDFKYRHYWNRGADEIVFEKGALNQIGAEHMCIINGKTLYFDTVRPNIENNQWTYGEVLKDPAPFKYFGSNFFLEPIDEHNTLLKIEFDIQYKLKLFKLINPFFRKRLEKQGQTVFKDLKETARKFSAGEI